jgi:REP element-mobilizing transposase RayT
MVIREASARATTAFTPQVTTRPPPPKDEHAGLHRWHRERSGEPITFDVSLRIVVVQTFVRKLSRLDHRVIACSCSDKHLHALCELPSDYKSVVREVGKGKQRVSHALRDILPGTIWSAGGEYKPIRDRGHLQNTYHYIRKKQEAQTVVWSHARDEDWIADASVGVVLMQLGQARIRVFACAQTPASEGTPEDPDPEQRP